MARLDLNQEPARSKRAALPVALQAIIRRVCLIWCARHDSNVQPRVPETRALSVELRAQWWVRECSKLHRQGKSLELLPLELRTRETGAPDWIRTSTHPRRKRLICPVELRAHNLAMSAGLEPASSEVETRRLIHSATTSRSGAASRTRTCTFLVRSEVLCPFSYSSKLW